MAYSGQTVAIVGGTGGIGYAIARQLLTEGAANIALLDICDNSGKSKELQRDFENQNVILLIVDVTKRESVEKAFNEVIREFNRIDLLINSAAILNEKEVEAVLNTNVLGVINTSLVGLDVMSKANNGHGGLIVNISSVMGLTTIPSIPTYIASKHAVVGFTRSLAHEFYLNKHGVKFLVICPGLTETPMIQGFAGKVLFEDTVSLTNDILSKLPVQSTAVAAKCLAELIPTAENGSVWILDDGQSEKVDIPKYWGN